jgi:hypothetical protein
MLRCNGAFLKALLPKPTQINTETITGTNPILNHINTHVGLGGANIRIQQFNFALTASINNRTTVPVTEVSF